MKNEKRPAKADGGFSPVGKLHEEFLLKMGKATFTPPGIPSSSDTGRDWALLIP